MSPYYARMWLPLFFRFHHSPYSLCVRLCNLTFQIAKLSQHRCANDMGLFWVTIERDLTWAFCSNEVISHWQESRSICAVPLCLYPGKIGCRLIKLWQFHDSNSTKHPFSTILNSLLAKKKKAVGYTGSVVKFTPLVMYFLYF